MADDLKKTGKGDDARINVNQVHEVTYWSKTLDCTGQKLKDAVKAVGPMVRDVKDWLVKNK